MTDILGWLQEWYFSNCDGDWEHTCGVEIDTLDNPGWSIIIDLEDTDLENKSFEGKDLERSEDDWIFCKVESKKFKMACGPLNLVEAINIFQRWAINSAPQRRQNDF